MINSIGFTGSIKMVSVLFFGLLSTIAVAESRDIDSQETYGFQRVYHNSYKKHKQHSGKKPSDKQGYGKKYPHYKNNYANKYWHNKHYANKYHYPSGYRKKPFKKKYHHRKFKHKHYYNEQYKYKRKAHNAYLGLKGHHISFKKDYWRAHKHHGYEHRRVRRQHYYYNDKGFYFPNFGFIGHGHKHHEGCDDWHFSPRVAQSLLSSIYHK